LLFFVIDHRIVLQARNFLKYVGQMPYKPLPKRTDKDGKSTCEIPDAIVLADASGRTP
jgi:hypothetical protein